MSWRDSEKVKFEITGTLSKKREDIIDWLEEKNDWRYTSKLSEVEVLIVGDKPGTKLQKAIENKIDIAYEKDIIEHLGEIITEEHLPTVEKWWNGLSDKEETAWEYDLTEEQIEENKYYHVKILDEPDLTKLINLKGIIKDVFPSSGDEVLLFIDTDLENYL